MGLKKQGLGITVHVRDKNRRLVLVLSRLIGFCAPVLRGRVAAWLGNQVLRLYQVEVGAGRWQRVDHGIAMEPV